MARAPEQILAEQRLDLAEDMRFRRGMEPVAAEIAPDILQQEASGIAPDRLGSAPAP